MSSHKPEAFNEAPNDYGDDDYATPTTKGLESE